MCPCLLPHICRYGAAESEPGLDVTDVAQAVRTLDIAQPQDVDPLHLTPGSPSGPLSTSAAQLGEETASPIKGLVVQLPTTYTLKVSRILMSVQQLSKGLQQVSSMNVPIFSP